MDAFKWSHKAWHGVLAIGLHCLALAFMHSDYKTLPSLSGGISPLLCTGVNDYTRDKVMESKALHISNVERD